MKSKYVLILFIALGVSQVISNYLLRQKIDQNRRYNTDLTIERFINNFILIEKTIDSLDKTNLKIRSLQHQLDSLINRPQKKHSNHVPVNFERFYMPSDEDSLGHDGIIAPPKY